MSKIVDALQKSPLFLHCIEGIKSGKYKLEVQTKTIEEWQNSFEPSSQSAVRLPMDWIKELELEQYL